MGQQKHPTPTDADLDAMQWVADPPADRTVAAIVGPWPAKPAMGPSTNAAATDPGAAACLSRIAELNAIIQGWKDNKDVKACWHRRMPAM